MKIAFFSNFMDHHTAPLCKELYRLTNGEFVYVELTEMPVSYKKTGYPDFSTLPFILPVWKDSANIEKAKEICKSAVVAIFNGVITVDYMIIRAKSGGLSFDLSERLLKKGILNVLSPRILKYLWYYHTIIKEKPFYKLCKSAYCATDQYKLRSYYERCFNWAYFTEVNEWGNDIPVNITGGNEECRIMWCSRFINWKHPELMVDLAACLKRNGVKAHIDMYGGGERLEIIKKYCLEKKVEDYITFAGNIPNHELVLQMRNHHIFILTSDKQEGWGAVANEAMSNGCVFVGSDEEGSVLCLVDDDVNGMIFKSGDVNSLYNCVVKLIEHPEERKTMALNAFKTMKDIWSPKVGAEKLMNLIQCLQTGQETPYKTGPCSRQYPR